MDKKQLRKEILAKVNMMQPSEYEQLSLAIGTRLLNEQAIKEANVIAMTISRKTEVQTKQMIKQLWELGKTVVVPKCHPTDRSMTFHKIDNFNQLETVYMDLKEPIVEKTEFIPKNKIDIIIVPGVVYDRLGYRIGYGGGYYDRFLADYSGVRITIAYHCQLVDRVPKESHDIPVHLIITEKERIECMSH